MNRYTLSALTLVILSSAIASHASALDAVRSHVWHHGSTAVRQKRVLLVLDSQTVARRRVQVGDTVYLLEPTRMVRFFVPVGTPVISRSSMSTHADGELLAMASSQTNGQRVVID